MRKRLTIFYLLSNLFISCIFSQSTPKGDSFVEVYPLQVGNLWQFWTYDFINGQTTWIYGWTERVVRDTLMSNGKIYSVIVSDGNGGGIRRQQGSQILSYVNADSDFVRFDFSKTKGDTVWSLKVGLDTLFCTIVMDNIATVFGQNRRQQVYFIKNRNSSEGIRYTLTDGFGITKIYGEPDDEWLLRGAIINGVRYGTISSVQDNVDNAIPQDIYLFRNYPNPFNAGTMISFQLQSTHHINLSVYDLLGRNIKTIINQELSSGRHEFFWDGREDKSKQLSSGIYICRIQSNSFLLQRKMLMLK